MNDKKDSNSGGRQSNLELFRIITMVIIVAHHYVVNSGLMECVTSQVTASYKDYFLLLFGWGGKTGINCFIMITGYFMCKSQITVKKYIKLIGEVEFYNIAIFVIFCLSGHEVFTVKNIVKTIFPFFTITNGFIACFLLFYLFIPFLNKLLSSLSEKEHIKLIAICVFIYTILPSFANAKVAFNYITWFSIIYIISSYFRLYPHDWMADTKKFTALTLIMVVFSWISILAIYFLAQSNRIEKGYEYFFVSDSNKILALLTAICAFLMFKNMKIKNNIFINTVASSAFGVLLIHANSDTMRMWLWREVARNLSYYETKVIVLHAFLTVIAIYIISTVIDQVRIKFIEKPFLLFVDDIIAKKKIYKK